MKLKYSILWFDDDEEQFKSHDFEDLVAEINSWGFDFDEPVYVQTAKEFMKKKPFSDFDLIVVDYNIGEDGKHGGDFIEEVRSYNVYAEIIFYTAGGISELWDSVKEKNLDGIFLSNNTGIIQKVIQVFRQSVNKVVDLENMRGIVMAQVGDMDNIMKEILQAGLTQIEDEQLEAIYESFIKRQKKFIKKKCGEIQQFSKNASIKKMLDLCDSSYPIWSLVKELIKRHPDLQNSGISKYDKEIIQPRNTLAHGVPKSQEGGIQCFVHRRRKFKYSKQSAKKIRGDLKKYKDIYEEILSQISPEPRMEEISDSKN